MDYTYVIYTKERQIIKGKISAASEQSAIELLTKAGHRVISLKPAPSLFFNLEKYLPASVKRQDVAFLSRQLALLIDSGISISHCLEILSEQSTNKTMKKALAEIVIDLRSGSSLSTALSKHPRIFPSLYPRMIAVGEKTGELSPILRSLAEHIEREITAMNKLKGALTYPAIVFLLAIAIIILLVTVALPPLISLLTGLGVPLPLPTQFLLFGVNFTKDYGLYLLFTLVTLVIAIYLYRQTPSGGYQWDKLMLSLPLIGRLILLTELSRCCRHQSLLLKAGLPLPEVMTITRQASSNRVIATALAEVEARAIKGEGLAKPMSRNHLFPPLMVTMTRVGEETGNLDETLMTVAQNYEFEADNKLRTILGLIEPMMIIFLGVFVGFIVLSIFLPLYGALLAIGG